MSERSAFKIWRMRGTFVFLVGLILFFQLLPLDTTPRRWVGPDYVLTFAVAWSLRRPEYVPAPALAGLFLLVDFLLQRPPGLWAACALVACERLKTRVRMMREGTFTGEWLMASLAMTGVILIYRLGLTIAFLEPPSLGLSLFELIMSILFYPAAVAMTHWIFGVRRASAQELDTIGGRL